MKVETIGFAANTMAPATRAEWIEFIMLLGGKAAIELADAISDLSKRIDSQRDLP